MRGRSSVVVSSSKVIQYDHCANENTVVDGNRCSLPPRDGSNGSRLQPLLVLLSVSAVVGLLNPHVSYADSTSTALSTIGNGILASKGASLIHPISNFAFYGTSIYSAYLGYQWRRLREVNEEIKMLNKPQSTLPDVTAAVLDSNTDTDTMRLKDLQAIKKDLTARNLKDKHYLSGSILLGGGVTVSILGAFNTYIRTGELFPGPHLYGGMAITILWAVAASLVPAMQKGNDAARIAHITANTANLLLFTYQILTGLTELSYLFEE